MGLVQAVWVQARRSCSTISYLRRFSSSSSKKSEGTTVGRCTHAGPIASRDAPSQHTSVYPTQFQATVHGRIKRKLGNVFDLTNFGVNLTILEPGASSSLQHFHSKQDEFVYLLKGTATLKWGTKEFTMCAGDCVGFKAGDAIGHCITNDSNIMVVEYLEIGDRTAGDEVVYPMVDLKAKDVNGQWRFTRKSGEPYE